MKKLLPFILVLFSVISIAQPAYQMPYIQSSSWSVRVGTTNGSGNNCVFYREINYTIIGDSLINGNLYQTLHSSGVTYEMSFMPPTQCNTTPVYYSEPAGFLRNVGQKVFYLPPADSIEVLLYDFDLEVGDTLPDTYNHFGNNITTITNIDTILVNGVQRRQYYLYSMNGTMATKFIEGIGHDRGLLERIDVMFDYASELYCYAENGIPVFPLSGAFCFSGLPSSMESLSFEVHPNPSYGTMSVSLNENNSKPVTVSLLDVTGRKVHSEQMMVTDGILPFSTNLKGIFQLVIESESNTATRKVVIY